MGGICSSSDDKEEKSHREGGKKSPHSRTSSHGTTNSTASATNTSASDDATFDYSPTEGRIVPRPATHRRAGSGNAAAAAAAAESMANSYRTPGNMFDEEGAVLNQPLDFTAAEKEYVKKGTNESESLHRLCDVEEMRRSELFAAWCLDSQRMYQRFQRRKRTGGHHLAPSVSGDFSGGVTFAADTRQPASGSTGGAPIPLARKTSSLSRLVIHHRTVSVIDEQGAPLDDADNDALNATNRGNNMSILGDASFRAAAGEGWIDATTPTIVNTHASPTMASAAAATSGGGGGALLPSPSGLHTAGTHLLGLYTSQGEFTRDAPSPRSSVLFRGISARGVAVDHKTKCVKSPTWHFLTDPRAAATLNEGNGFFAFACKNGDKLNAEEVSFMSSFLNVTQFADEVEENNVPIVTFQESYLKPFVTILVKAMYALPGVSVADITDDLIASPEYNTRCQPGNPKIWTDVTEERTMRCTKSIIRFVYSIVIQMKIAEITDEAQLRSLSRIDGVTPSKAIILERTKRNKANVDATAKCKSLLMYYAVDGGVIVCHCTALLNTQVPGIIASVINNFGSSGAVEAADTANLTRKYLVEKFGDHRCDPAPAEVAPVPASGVTSVVADETAAPATAMAASSESPDLAASKHHRSTGGGSGGGSQEGGSGHTPILVRRRVGTHMDPVVVY